MTASPEPPLQVPQQRRRHWRWGALAVVVVGVVAAQFVGPPPPSSPDAALGGSPAAAAAPLVADAGADAVQAMQKVLNDRAAAALAHDERGFLAHVATDDRAFVARQKALYRSLHRLPLRALTTRLDGPTSAAMTPSAAAVKRWGTTARLVAADTEYDFGYQAQGGGWYAEPFTFVQRQGSWWLVDDRSGREQIRERGDAVPWQLGESWTVRGSRSIVVANAKERSQLPGIAKRVDAAVRTVVKVWAADHRVADEDRTVVVMASGDPQRLRKLNGSQGSPPSAVTFARRDLQVDDESESGAPTDIHVVLNSADRSARSGLVLTHEVTHALLMGHEYVGTPTWIAEGTAEFTAYHGLSLAQLLERRGLDGPTDAAIRAHRYRITLPSSASFYRGDDGTVGARYSAALLLCAYVAHRYGDRRLVLLHEQLSTILTEAESPKRTDALIRSQLGISRQRLLADASDWVRTTVRREFGV